ncbi:phage holin family protein [Herbiconiux sp. SYSU D00978]|uniref:phage holin family protein n=1 Tax=Herbiconiux sp. SYSU D00978 TaxID=2812562 RepID=UPI001A9591F4|nr:phage holin family protein [Herbiconiux sp. SYSU D00978]
MSVPVNERRSVFKLIADIPTLLIDLIKSELANLKNEVTAKLKAVGIGAGLLIGAGVLALYLFGVLLVAAIWGLGEFLPIWLSALIVAVLLIIVIAVLALLGVKKLKQGVPPTPEETIDSVKKDVKTLSGTPGSTTTGRV